MQIEKEILKQVYLKYGVEGHVYRRNPQNWQQGEFYGIGSHCGMKNLIVKETFFLGRKIHSFTTCNEKYECPQDLSSTINRKSPRMTVEKYIDDPRTFLYFDRSPQEYP